MFSASSPNLSNNTKTKALYNSRRYLLKEQCIVNFFTDGKILDDEQKRKIMQGKYFNLYYLITKRNHPSSWEEEDKSDKIYLEELQINQKEVELINLSSDRTSKGNQSKLLKQSNI